MVIQEYVVPGKKQIIVEYYVQWSYIRQKLV